jgi:predicted Zn-dependent peptidase
MTNVGRGRDPAAVSARIDQLFNELVLTEADLAAAVARQTLQLAMGERDPTTRAIGIQSALAAGLPPDHDYIAQLGQVTLADLEAMVAVLRRPRHEVLVLPQPEEAP